MKNFYIFVCNCKLRDLSERTLVDSTVRQYAYLHPTELIFEIIFPMIKYHVRKIAVATNFSTASDNALEHAAAIAKSKNASLDIIHAVSPSESRNKKAQYVSNAYSRLKVYAKSIVERYGVEVNVFARVSDVVAFCYKYCVDRAIDLLLIGVQTGIRKYLGATTAYEVIMKVECPVLSVPAGFNKIPFRRILFPVRDVDGVDYKLVYTQPFVDNAAIHMICFGDPGREKVMELVAMAKQMGIRFDEHEDISSFNKMLPSHVVGAARDANDDLIVINATREKEWYNILGENYTAYILKESDIAVLSITHLFQSANP